MKDTFLKPRQGRILNANQYLNLAKDTEIDFICRADISIKESMSHNHENIQRPWYNNNVGPGTMITVHFTIKRRLNLKITLNCC